MFFDSWADLGRVILIGVLAYVALLLLLRVSGKRTLSKLNAFDFVITVALGSTLATILLSKEVSLAEGATAFAVLIFLQFAVTWSAVRSRTLSRLVKSEPAMLFYRGEFLDAAMQRERVTRPEMLAVIRESGAASLDDVEAVVMETAGTISVIRRPATSDPGGEPGPLLRGVNAPPRINGEADVTRPRDPDRARE